jgi:hypothetical protein
MSDRDVIKEFTQGDAQTLRAVGGMANALWGRMSELSTQDFRSIDNDFLHSGGNLASCVQSSGRDPLTVSREWVYAGQINASDPRFAAAFRVQLEPRDTEKFLKEHSDRAGMNKTLVDLQTYFQKEGNRSETFKAQAWRSRLIDSGISPAAMGVVLEKIAFDGIVDVDKQKSVLIQSVRYANAGCILKARLKSRQKTARDEQR